MDSLWDFHRDGLTKSFIEVFQTCKEQCKQEYIVGWTKTDEPIWFNFGNHIHYVLQHVYQDGKFPPDERIEELLLEYRRKRFGNQEVSPEKNYENQIIYELGKAVLRTYFFRFKADFNWSWIRTEEVFKVPFEDTYLTGKFDGIVLEDLFYRLFDHKCLSRIAEDNIQAELAFDVQFNLYMYACQYYYGEIPKYFVYNIIRRPTVKPKPGETAEHFSDRIMLEILGDLDHWFPRLTIKIEPIELNIWVETQLKKIVADIRYWWSIGCESYVNRHGLEGNYGRCHLFHLITSGSTGGLRKKTTCFEELEL